MRCPKVKSWYSNRTVQRQNSPFRMSALHGRQWPASRPGRFIIGKERHDTHRIDDWVGPQPIWTFWGSEETFVNGGIELRFLGRPARGISSPTILTKLLASSYPTVITFSKRQTQMLIRSWAVTPKSISINPSNFVKYGIKLETWICRYTRLVKVTFCGPQGVRVYSSTCVRFWKNSVFLWYRETRLA